MKKLLVFLMILCLYSCKSDIEISHNLYVKTFDTADQTELIFVNKDNLMFSIVAYKVIAYKVCDKYIFIVQHPLKENRVIDENITNYYTLDKKMIDENYVPQPLTKQEFDTQLSGNCGDVALIHL